jgi:hypothetical protein
MSGIRTIDDIRQRCVIDEAGCWVWRHATTTANGRPAAYIPEIGRVGTIAHAFKLINGKTCSRSYFPAKCMSRLCCNPAHQQLLTRSQLTKMTTPAPSLLTRGRMAAGRARVAPLKLKPEQYLEIRGSTMLLREIMLHYGVSRCYASQLRSGVAPIFRSLAGGGTQHVAPGSSVFSWRPA